MKKIVTLLLTLLSITCAWSHALWLETSPTGQIGKEKEVKVFYGEYGHNILETVGDKAFNNVKQFSLWVTAPDGSKEKLTTSPKESYYSVIYTPKQVGLYTVELDNDNIDVADYSAYDFGIIKTHYHSTAKFTVGTSLKNTIVSNKSGLVIQDVTGSSDSLKLKVLYKGEALKETEVLIDITDQWSKKCYTDKNGEITLNLPWEINYFIEVTKKEETPGIYKGESYEFIWHCATYMINK